MHQYASLILFVYTIAAGWKEELFDHDLHPFFAAIVNTLEYRHRIEILAGCGFLASSSIGLAKVWPKSIEYSVERSNELFFLLK
jgi:hypothetical protein